MTKKLMIIKSFALFFLLLLSSCSFLNPQSSNEFTVTKKSPLVMPPDMNMAPPESKGERKRSYNAEKSFINDDKVSVEDILTGEIKTKKNINTNKTVKIKNTRKKLVNKILRTRASKILE